MGRGSHAPPWPRGHREVAAAPSVSRRGGAMCVPLCGPQISALAPRRSADRKSHRGEGRRCPGCWGDREKERVAELSQQGRKFPFPDLFPNLNIRIHNNGLSLWGIFVFAEIVSLEACPHFVSGGLGV